MTAENAPEIPLVYTEEAMREAKGLPTTQPLDQARDLLTAALDPEWWDIWIQRAVLVFVILVLTAIILRIGRRLILSLQQSRNLPDAVVLPIRRTLRGLVLLVALLIALQFMGVPMTTIWATASGILALIAVGFIAVWSVLCNVACSLLLVIFKPFRIGDYVEMVDNAAGPNVGGRVTDVTPMYVVLREEAEDGAVSFAQIPNNLFFQKTIRRRAGKRSIPLEAHIDKHGLIGREQPPPRPT